MTNPLTITGIAGSLRSASYSRVVLQSIAALLPEGTRFETLDIGALPHYIAMERGKAAAINLKAV
jgi:chromate reductase, NAD(P)H dehydrogenase (quinone)